MPRPCLATEPAESNEPAEANEPTEANEPAESNEPAEASLEIAGPDEAVIYVDDRYVGVAPATLRLAAGEHEVGVYAAGYEPSVARHHLAAGTTTIDPTLRPTAQRVAALVAISVGLAGLAVGVGLGAASLALPEDHAYSDAPAPSANDMRLAASLAGGLGALTFSVGGLLYLFDAPPLPGATVASARPTGLTWTFTH